MRSLNPLVSAGGKPTAGDRTLEVPPGDAALGLLYVPVGVAVPELGPDPVPGSDDVEAKSVDND